MRFWVGVMVLVVTTLTTAAEVENAPALGHVLRPGVNVRVGPGVRYEIAGTLDPTHRLRIVGDLYDWYKVYTDKPFALFVSAKFVRVEAAVGTVLASRVNARAQPGLDATVVAQLARNQKVVVRPGGPAGWLSIDAPKQTLFYVHKQLVRTIASEPAPSGQATAVPVSQRLPALAVPGAAKMLELADQLLQVQLAKPIGSMRFDKPRELYNQLLATDLAASVANRAPMLTKRAKQGLARLTLAERLQTSYRSTMRALDEAQIEPGSVEADAGATQ